MVTGRGGRSTSMPSPGQLVEPLAVDLDRRHHRRDLLDGADERARPPPARRSSVTPAMSWVAVTSPAASSVEVSVPSTTSPT